MVWNKSGYNNKFSGQQMHIMNEREKADKLSREKSKKDQIEDVQERIVELLSNETVALSQVEIAERIKVKDLLVLEALNSIDKNKVSMIVTPIDDSGNSVRWQMK